MGKRKPKKQRKGRSRPRTWRRRQPELDLESISRQVEKLTDRGRAREALDLLEPLVAAHPNVADLHYFLGYARYRAGDLWGALAGYERAMELSRDPNFWVPLASLYLELELHAHALHAFRQMFRHGVETPLIDEARREVALLEQDIMDTADHLGLSVAQVEKGLQHLEDGQQALNRQDYAAAIAANRRAASLLDDWPPPHNNLSLALFFHGEPAEAIAVARRVLRKDPDNIQALSNAIRFLAWTGQEAEARLLWARLQGVSPVGSSECLKKVEAAAILNEDEAVYELLEPLVEGGSAEGEMRLPVWQPQLLLAVAEANTNRRSAAQRRLQALRDQVPWAADLLAALRAGRPGPGWAQRFPYFHSSELIPKHEMEAFVNLITRQGEMPPKRFRREIDRFVTRFPQLVRVAEKLIWEENQPMAGIGMLDIVATPEAYAALRRFGLSQAGDDDTRMQALSTLAQAGQIDEDETLRVWHDGQWREVQLRRYQVTEEGEPVYSTEVAGLLNDGLEAFKRNDLARAERLFQRVLDLEPRAKEGYNNLGTLYARRGDHEQAKEMFQAALELDPTYVFPRCNLALYLLDEDDIEGAEAMMVPLADVTQFRPPEMAFYSYLQARLLMYRQEFEAARRALEAALQVYPGYEPAESLMEHLDMAVRIQTGWQSFMERQRKRDQAHRARLQAKLSAPDPALSDVLPLYVKDALTGMARVVILWGGWTGLRKAPLIERIIEMLHDRDNLERVVADLNDEERDALRTVLEAGGSMPWQDFDARYGNDLEESRYWQWHEPESVMGRLRLRGLLAEATVEGELLIVVPSDLRQTLREILA